MSAIEMQERLHAIIDRHASNEVWLARIFEILENAEPNSNENWWNELTHAEQSRLDASLIAAQKGEFLSNEDVLDRL